MSVGSTLAAVMVVVHGSGAVEPPSSARLIIIGFIGQRHRCKVHTAATSRADASDGSGARRLSGIQDSVSVITDTRALLARDRRPLANGRAAAHVAWPLLRSVPPPSEAERKE